MKFKHFEYEDGRTTKEAYIDGYAFGDRLLEGVPFKITVKSDGTLAASLVNPNGGYEKGLNRRKWEKDAKDYAKDCDMFFANADLSGEDLLLVRC